MAWAAERSISRRLRELSCTEGHREAVTPDGQTGEIRQIDIGGDRIVGIAQVALEDTEVDIGTIVKDVPARLTLQHRCVRQPDLEVRAVGCIQSLNPQVSLTISHLKDADSAGSLVLM